MRADASVNIAVLHYEIDIFYIKIIVSYQNIGISSYIIFIRLHLNRVSV